MKTLLGVLDCLCGSFDTKVASFMSVGELNTKFTVMLVCS